MKRGDLYLVRRPDSDDPRRERAFVVVGSQALIDSSYVSVVCAPVYSRYLELAMQVPVGEAEGLKHDSAIHCDGLLSIRQDRLQKFIGTLRPERVRELNQALRVALGAE